MASIVEVRVMRRRRHDPGHPCRTRGQGPALGDVSIKHLFDPELYLRAYGKIYRNAGAMTKGSTDGDGGRMSLQKIQGIIDLLRQERYRWTPVRRTDIPKANGKMRPLGIPTWSDKLLQEVLRSLLEPYYEPQFSDHSHGFRPDRGCHTALREITEDVDGDDLVHRGRHQRMLR